MTKTEKAASLRQEGYNCAQAVLGAFSEEAGLTPEQALKIAAPFGGGIGQTRETCGALSGLLMAAGLIAGSGRAEDKHKAYADAKALMDEFAAVTGSVLCRELLGFVNGEKTGAPAVRVPEEYKDRPCEFIVKAAVEIGEKELINRG